MIQTSFLDDPNLLARKRDPDTSKDAAVKTVAFKSSHEGLIWGALEKSGSVTQNEVSGLSPVQANRRFKAMADRKLIKRNGEKRGNCMVWVKA